MPPSLLKTPVIVESCLRIGRRHIYAKRSHRTLSYLPVYGTFAVEAPRFYPVI
jgi:hypothetical protein